MVPTRSKKFHRGKMARMKARKRGGLFNDDRSVISAFSSSTLPSARSTSRKIGNSCRGPRLSFYVNACFKCRRVNRSSVFGVFTGEECLRIRDDVFELHSSWKSYGSDPKHSNFYTCGTASYLYSGQPDAYLREARTTNETLTARFAWAYERILHDFARTGSLTVAIELPKSGGGLQFWPSENGPPRPV